MNPQTQEHETNKWIHQTQKDKTKSTNTQTQEDKKKIFGQHQRNYFEVEWPANPCESSKSIILFSNSV